MDEHAGYVLVEDKGYFVDPEGYWFRSTQSGMWAQGDSFEHDILRPYWSQEEL